MSHADLDVRLQPRARVSELGARRADGSLVVRVTDPPVDGRANRALCRLLDREILDAFWDRCLLYVRTFTPGIDVPWQTFFGTPDPEAVEQACRAAGQRCEWTGSGALRVSRRGPGVVVHPRTGETTFFNEVQLHHVGRLDAETGGALRRLYGDGDLPRDVRFGDGSPIPDRFMERVATACDALAVDLEWQAGDVLVLDNLLVAHARRPYAGRYRVLTATGHLVRPGDVRQVSSCPLAPSL